MLAHLIGRMLGISSYKEKTTALVLSAQEILYRVILVILTVTSILWMSILLYAFFYYTYMPAVSHSRPIHLQFKSCGRESGICSFPSSNVTLTDQEQLLMGGQAYRVVVEFEMPESPGNQNCGMFMVCAELKDTKKEVVESSCRSGSLRYRSGLLHSLAVMFLFPLLFTGSVEEKQIVSVELFQNFEEAVHRPVTEAYIEVQSQHIEIYRSFLKIHAEFSGIRYLMFHWPLLSAVIGVTTNMFFLAIIAFLSWYKFFTPKKVVVHSGYDANHAPTVEERRAQAVQRVRREREAEKAASTPVQPITHVSSSTDLSEKEKNMKCGDLESEKLTDSDSMGKKDLSDEPPVKDDMAEDSLDKTQQEQDDKESKINAEDNDAMKELEPEDKENQPENSISENKEPESELRKRKLANKDKADKEE